MPRNYRSKKRSYKQKLSRRSKKLSLKRKKGGAIRAGTRPPQTGGFVRAGTRPPQLGGSKSHNKKKRFRKYNRKGGCACSANIIQ